MSNWKNLIKKDGTVRIPDYSIFGDTILDKVEIVREFMLLNNGRDDWRKFRQFARMTVDGGGSMKEEWWDDAWESIDIEQYAENVKTMSYQEFTTDWQRDADSLREMYESW